jgi:hypothetical protein
MESYQCLKFKYREKEGDDFTDDDINRRWLWQKHGDNPIHCMEAGKGEPGFFLYRGTYIFTVFLPLLSRQRRNGRKLSACVRLRCAYRLPESRNREE